MAKSSYLSNVLKSIKYATIDAVAEMNPVIVEQYTSNKDFVKETIDNIKSSSGDNKNGDYVKNTIRKTYKNLKDDLLSGNFYNKTRIEQEENAAMEKVFGLDFSSFDGLDDAFNESDDSSFNMDWDDDSFGGDDSDSLTASDKYTANVMSFAMGQTTKAIKKSNSKSARALGGLMVETSKFNADVIAASTEKMLGGIGAASGIMHNDLTALNANLGKVIEFTDSALRTHIENSTTFFETQKQQMQEQTEILKEIRDMQANLMNPKKKKDNESINISDIFGSEGSLDLRAYKDYLKQNKRGFENTQVGMLGMIKDFGPLMMASLTGSPLSGPLKALVKKAIPQALEDAFTSLNDTIAGVISTSLVNLTQASKTGRHGGFFQFLGDMFGLQVPDLTMDMSKYNKEAVPWTGKDHKALTEVIPTWLSKIYSGITGKEEQRFDYDKGKFISSSNLKKMYDKEYNAAIAKANYSINKELTENLNKIRFSNAQDKKSILDAIEKIEKYNFKQMKNFNPNSKRAEDLDPKTYGIDGPNADKIMQIVRVLWGSTNKRTQLKGSNELLTSISDYNKDIREREASGEHVFNALFNGSLSEKQLQGTPIMASAERLDTTNHLLQSILDAVSRGGSSRNIKRKKNKNTNKKVKTVVNTDGTAKTETVDATSFDISIDDPEKITEMLENAEPQEITETYVESIQKADRASDKLKAFFSGFALLTKKPAEFLKNTINTVDTYAYSLFFGNGEEDVHSISQKIAKGFDNVFAKIGDKVSSTFKAVKEEVTKEGKTTANGLFKAMFGVDLDQYSKDFKKAMFGDENKPFFQGMGETMRKGFGEIMDDIFGPIKQKFNRYFGKDKDEDADLFADIKEGAKTTVNAAAKAYKESRDQEKAKQDAIEKIKKGDFEGSFIESGAIISDAKQSEKQSKKGTTIQNAAAGLKVTKTGLVAVSEGERIIPKYMNAASIAGRQLKENSAINKFRHSMGLGDVQIANFADGGTVGDQGIVKEAGSIKYRKNMTYKNFNNFYNALPDDANKEYYRKKYARDFSEQALNKAKKQGAKTAADAKEKAEKIASDFIKSNPALADAVTEQINILARSKFITNTKRVFKAAKSYAGQVKEEAINAGNAAKEAFFSDDDELTKSVKYLSQRFAPGKEGKEAAADIAKNWKKYLPKSLAGAGVGAGLSVLFGLAGGPILGAAVGAATAITTKSNAVQKLLFGEKEVDENGNVVGRKGNLFSKQISTAVQKYAPDMAKGGAMGGLLASLPFMPGGPVTGLMIGSAIGFAKNNEEIKETLFGKDSILRNAPQILKKKLPKMGLGALTGALMGPFGLTTNLMIGSAIGFASDNEKFRGLLLGTKGIDGKYGGGVIGFIKNSLAIPVKGLGDLIDETREFFNKEIFEPLKRAGKVFFRQFQNIFYWIGDKVADTFTTHVWKPIGNLIAIKLIQPLEKVAGALLNIPKFLGKSMVKIIMSPIKALSDRLEARQLSKVGGAGGTAQDRIAQRQMMLGRYEENVNRVRKGPLKGLRRARAQRKYDRLQNRLTNSEANRQDEFMADPNMDLDQMQQMLLVNESLGKLGGVKNSQKAIKRYAKATLSHTNLNEILNSHVTRKQLAEEQRKLIIDEVSKGESKQSIAQIMQYTDLPQDNKFALCAKIKEVAAKVKKGIQIAENATATKEEWRSKFGINIGGAAQRRQLERQIEEMKQKQKKSMPDPEKITEGLTPETTSEKYLFGISSDVHTIAKSFMNRHDALQNAQEQVDQIRQNAGVLALPGPTLDNQYELTENGVVKMKTNDQGELEPDEQDSQTRETLKRRDDKEQTQKGILGKLTGIGSSVLEFFGKDKEEKKPNVFQKILSVLGIGFSFLGGGKIGTILKGAGLLAGAGLLFAKKIPEKDSEGNPVFDEYGNPVYKSIANIIWDKISPVLVGIKDWFVDTAWPAIKTFTTKEVLPTIGDGLKNIWNGLGDISEKILDWTFDKFIPRLIDEMPEILGKIIDAIPKALGVAVGAAKKGVMKLFGLKDSDIENPDETQEVDRGFEVSAPPDGASGNTTIENSNYTPQITNDNKNQKSESMYLRKNSQKSLDGTGKTTTTSNSQASTNNNDQKSESVYLSKNSQKSLDGTGKTTTTSNSQASTNNNSTTTSNSQTTGSNNSTNTISTGSNESKIKDALKNSPGFKKIQSTEVEKAILGSKDIIDNWDKKYALYDGTQYTLGQLLTSEGVYIGVADSGVIYSDDLMANPHILSEFTGGEVEDILPTNQEAEDNSYHFTKTVPEKIAKALLIQGFNKGQLPNFGTKAARLINSVYHAGVQGTIARTLPGVMKWTALGIDKLTEFGVNTPLKIAEKTNLFFRNKASGMGIKDSVKNAIFSNKKKKKKTKKKTKTKTKTKTSSTTTTPKVDTDAVEKIKLNPDDVFDEDSAFKKIINWIKDKMSKSKILNKIKEKLNNAICKAAKFKNVTNTQLKKIIEKIADKIPEAIMKHNDHDTIIKKVTTHIANAVGTAGAQIITTALLSFANGMSLAHAYFQVEEATLSEMVIAGILEIISNTLLFGLIGPKELIDIACTWFATVLDLSDLRRRQKLMKIIVDTYNDQHRENLSPYDYLMDRTIQGKIDKFIKSSKIAKILASDVDTVLAIGSLYFTSALPYAAHAVTTSAWVWSSALNDTIGGGKNFSEALDYYADQGEEELKNSPARKRTIEGIKEIAENRKETWDEVFGKNKDDDSKSAVRFDQSQMDAAQKEYRQDQIEEFKNAGVIGGNNLYDADAYQKLLEKNGEINNYNILDTVTTNTGNYLKLGETTQKNTKNVFSLLNGAWSNISKNTTPFFSNISDAMTKATKVLSKNIAVAYGLADADDKDVDIFKILGDDNYLAKRAQTIQDNSILAALFAGITGSNSNSSKKQEAAAQKVLKESNGSSTSTSNKNSAISTATKRMLMSEKKLASKTLTVNLHNSKLASPMASAFGSGINGNDVKDIDQNTAPSENEFVSQKYGKYANKTFGIGTQREKVSDAGCAPSTAVMAVNSNLGNISRLTMEDALKHASGYIANNGGVTPDYFADEFRRYGFKTAYVSKSDNKQKDVMKYQLMNGRSIVLMGRNTSNRSKKRSPFGPNYHYVVATGMSADGKYVYISDPEAKSPNVKYTVDEIFNNTDLSIIPIEANGRIKSLAGRLRTNLKQLSGKKTSGIIFVGDSRTAGMKDAIGENDKTKFICKIGKGLAWLKSTAYKELKELCKQYPDYYVVFNFGINDLNVSAYIDYYKNTIAKNISNKIIHMSINPIDATKAKKAGYQVTTADIEAFNTKYKEYAGKSYLDTYSYLKSNKFNASDGIHYDNETYKKIYNKTVDFINSNGGSISTSSSTDSSSDSGSSGTTSSGNHIKSFSDLISAIGSILAGSYGLSSSDLSDLSGDSSIDGTSTISTDGISGRVSSDSKVAKLQKQLVAQMKSVEGKLRYAQGNAKFPGSRNPDDGSGDCSSTVQWAYKKVTGKDIGSWTGAQNLSNATTFIEQPHLQSTWDESKLQLGDILLYGKDAEKHVEMYYGNGKSIGHGSGYGPKIKNLNYRTDDWSAKRLNEFMPAGKGTGLFVSQKDSKWRNRRIGDETVGQAGCAPAVATMAIDNSTSYNMDKAIKDAKKYKSSGNGVTADYFINTFKKQGYNTMVLTSKKKIINVLKQGNNAVLIGQDSKNTSKKRSPFGPNSHYVLATGISRDEKTIYISDPENNQPNIQYNTKTVLNAVKVAIVPIRIKDGRLNRYNEQLANALKNYNGKAVNLESGPIIRALQNMENTRKKDTSKWIYSTASSQIGTTFDGEYKNSKAVHHCNGPVLVIWALRAVNAISSGSNDLSVSNGQLSGSVGTEIKNGCKVKNYASSGKTAYQLISSGIIKPGDIVTFVGSPRILIYAGGTKWYCGDKIEGVTTSNGKFTTWEISKEMKAKVANIYTGKANKVSNSSSTSDSASSDTTDSGSDDTLDGTSESSSEPDTILDKLVKSFALLAEGWGLTSGNSSSSDVSSSDSSSDDSSSSSTTVSGSTTKAKIWNYLHDKGIPDNGIAGAMGNIQSESNFGLDAIESCYNADLKKQYADKISANTSTKNTFLGRPTINGTTYGPGYGLVQWTSSGRKAAMYDATVGKGMRIDSAQGQLDCLWNELNNGYTKTLNAMKSGSVRTATETFMTDFERPADQSQSAKDKRVANAEAVLKEMTGKGSGLSSIGINGKAGKAIASINTANSVNKAKDNARISKLLNSNSGLTSIGVNGRAGNAIASINRNGSKSSSPKLNFGDLVGKGSGVDFSSTVKSVSSNRVTRSYSTDTSSSSVNTLLGAIIKLLAQAVDNTASIQSIADAVVTLVDSKAANVTDVETKKQLLDTKVQMLNLIRQQNNASASTSLSDLISDMEAITSR